MKRQESGQCGRKENFYLQNWKLQQARLCCCLVCCVRRQRAEEYVGKPAPHAPLLRAKTGESSTDINSSILRANRKLLLPLTKALYLQKGHLKEMIKTHKEVCKRKQNKTLIIRTWINYGIYVIQHADPENYWKIIGENIKQHGIYLSIGIWKKTGIRILKFKS